MADPRNNARTIPSNFIKQDDHIDSADEYVNVRDEQLFWLNHNKLCAENIRRPVFSCRVGGQTMAGTHNLTGGSPNLESASNKQATYHPYYGSFEGSRVYTIINQEILLSPFVTSCEMVIRGMKKTLTNDPGDPSVFPVICRPDQQPQIDRNYSVAISSTSLAVYRVAAVPVPVDLKREEHTAHRLVRFALLIESKIDAVSAVEASGTTVATAYDYVDVANTLSSAIGDVVYSTSNPNVDFRSIIDIVPIDGSNDRLYVDRPFKTLPKSGVDVIALREASGIHMASISLYENIVADFDTMNELKR